LLLTFLQVFPTPALITRFSTEDLVQQAWPVVVRKVSKQRLLEDIYRMAQSSIGIPVDEDSEAVAMFRVVLGEMMRLCQLRDQLEQRAALHLKDNADFRRLQQIPDIGPILALTILAEAGDLRCFNHHRQLLKFCGLDLSTQQSGQFRGSTKLSKYGDARLRCAFWMAAKVAVRQTENSFRDKFERYLWRDPTSADRKRMAYVAVAAKMARVAHGIIKTGTDFRCFHAAAAPRGRAASHGPSRPLRTS
jgi:transposase